MDLIEITDELKASPGEYIYYEPTQQVVLCGSFNKPENKIVAMAGARLIRDDIEKFKKIKLNDAERKRRSPPRKCGSCGK